MFGVLLLLTKMLSVRSFCYLVTLITAVPRVLAFILEYDHSFVNSNHVFSLSLQAFSYS